MTTRLNSIPPVVAIEDYWGGIVASGASFPSSVVLGITDRQDILAEWTPEEFADEIIIDTIKALDVATNGLGLFADLGAEGTPVSGSGNLENYKIVGVSATAAPVQDTFVNWGFTGSIQDVSHYQSTYGGQDHFGDARKVALRHTGLLWILFSGATAPLFGLYTSPSSGTDGYAEATASGSAAVQITYGKTLGYASGSNIGGLTANGAGVAAQYVLVDFERGNW